MSRQFIVSHTSAEGFVEYSITTNTAEGALGHLALGLKDAGHEPSAVEVMLNRLTLALMEGRHEFTALDPDLKGRTTISVKQ